MLGFMCVCPVPALSDKTHMFAQALFYILHYEVISTSALCREHMALVLLFRPQNVMTDKNEPKDITDEHSDILNECITKNMHCMTMNTFLWPLSAGGLSGTIIFRYSSFDLLG